MKKLLGNISQTENEKLKTDLIDMLSLALYLHMAACKQFALYITSKLPEEEVPENILAIFDLCQDSLDEIKTLTGIDLRKVSPAAQQTSTQMN